MGKVYAEISMSLDGFVAGPDPTLEHPLGEGGEELHEWVYGLATWRERHGLEGGEENADSKLVAERLAATGAVVMGRRMFSGGQGPWEDDPNADGWWGDEPPFRVPVFVLTHHAREPQQKDGGTTFTFVTDGVGPAIEQAIAGAGGRDVQVAGGAMVIQQALCAGVVHELLIHVAPVLLGGGTALLEGLTEADVRLGPAQVTPSPRAVHLSYPIASA
ncbi:MAG TPA: dihydrofolate reductase family protein [Gaiellaceae bacterium]|nr:dihydrofolate reductase family protein [Gaiellaceae bacterium]